jgi:hypothetical protein
MEVRSFSIKDSGKLLAVAGALACMTGAPAVAQGETFPPGFGFGIGAEWRYIDVEATIRTTTGGASSTTSDSSPAGPGGMTYSNEVGGDSQDFGVDAFINFPPVANGRGRFGASVWAAPGASVDLQVCQSSGCSSFDTLFKLDPNDASVLFSYEHLLWGRPGMRWIGRAYAGPRWVSYDVSVAGNYSASDSGSEVVPAGGFDVSLEWDRPECCIDGFSWGLYGGAQVQGGFDVTNELSSFTSQEIEVDESLTWIVGVRARF